MPQLIFRHRLQCSCLHPTARSLRAPKILSPDRGQKHTWKYLMSLNRGKKFRNASGYMTADPRALQKTPRAHSDGHGSVTHPSLLSSTHIPKVFLQFTLSAHTEVMQEKAQLKAKTAKEPGQAETDLCRLRKTWKKCVFPSAAEIHARFPSLENTSLRPSHSELLPTGPTTF